MWQDLQDVVIGLQVWLKSAISEKIQNYISLNIGLNIISINFQNLCRYFQMMCQYPLKQYWLT